MLTSAALIFTGLTGLNVRVLGFSDWPLSRTEAPRDQLVPDPAPLVARAPRVATLAGGLDSVAQPATPDVAASTPTTAPVALVSEPEPTTSTDRPVANAASDADGDGLTDAAERELGTNPQRSDTDGDGVPDEFEVEYRLNPRLRTDAVADPDVDGVNNRNEYLVASDPHVADSNGDGVTDGATDSDGDGLPNAIEQKLGLNPAASVTRDVTAVTAPPTAVAEPSTAKSKSADAPVEQDASKPVADEPEKTVVSDGDLDSDGDGFSNVDEVQAGTDPADPASKPVVEEPPVDEPPVEEPPVEEPPVEQPPVEEPPAEQPPVEQPPAEAPPAEPPAADPAATEAAPVDTAAQPAG